MSKKGNRVLSLLTNQTGGKEMSSQDDVTTWAITDSEDVRYRVIDADSAKQLLVMNTNNRQLNKNLVNRKRLDLDAGLMRGRCSDVRVSKKGVLLDGQHTLAAIALSDQPLKMTVHVGGEEDDWIVLDCPSQRTAGQALDHVGIKNSNSIATMARGLMVWQNTGYPLACSGPAATESMTISQSKVVGYAIKHETLLRAALNEGGRLNRMIAALPSTSLGIIYVVLGDSDELLRNEFIEQVFGGESKSTMLRLLRSTLIKIAATPRDRRPSPQVTHAMIILTWNAWLANRELKIIRWQSSREDFPLVLKPSDLGV